MFKGIPLLSGSLLPNSNASPPTSKEEISTDKPAISSSPTQEQRLSWATNRELINAARDANGFRRPYENRLNDWERKNQTTIPRTTRDEIWEKQEQNRASGFAAALEKANTGAPQDFEKNFNKALDRWEADNLTKISSDTRKTFVAVEMYRRNKYSSPKSNESKTVFSTQQQANDVLETLRNTVQIEPMGSLKESEQTPAPTHDPSSIRYMKPNFQKALDALKDPTKKLRLKETEFSVIPKETGIFHSMFGTVGSSRGARDAVKQLLTEIEKLPLDMQQEYLTTMSNNMWCQAVIKNTNNTDLLQLQNTLWDKSLQNPSVKDQASPPAQSVPQKPPIKDTRGSTTVDTTQEKPTVPFTKAQTTLLTILDKSPRQKLRWEGGTFIPVGENSKAQDHDTVQNLAPFKNR